MSSKSELPPPPIDFGRAALIWTTRAGSKGYWRLIASAIAWSPTAGVLDQYVLAPSVVAGDVYGIGRLPLNPPFMFQILASARNHSILREPMLEGAIADSNAPNGAVFEKLEICDVRAAGQLIDPNEIAACISKFWPLRARIVTSIRDGQAWILDFPVHHLNSLQTNLTSAFQVETGPVLIPRALIDRPQVSVGDFRLAYVFFNQSNSVDLMLLNYPEGNTSMLRTYSHFMRLQNISVEIYGRAV